MKAPLVSVIMSFWNAERFIGEAIESVLHQTFDGWELLLIDDGSSDASTATALQYAKNCPEFVRYLEHKNHKNFGLPASRNVGVANAKGAYIALLDADDVWLPNKLEQQLEILFEYPEAEMVFGCSEYWRSWTGNVGDIGKDTLVQAAIPMTEVQVPPALLRLTLAGAPTPPPSNILVRTKALIGVGGFEDIFNGIYATYEDQAFLAKLYLTLPIFVSNQCWDKYRLHSDSLCAVQEREGRAATARLFYLRWLDSYLATQKITDPEIQRLLRKALWSSEHPFAHKFVRRGFGIAGRLKRKLTL
jgi:glycosyltransferase involved in cell wall biosynthesis